MKALELRIYGALLVVAAILSYLAWTDEGGETSQEDIVVFEPGKGGPVSVDWTGKRAAAHLEFTGSAEAVEVWITAGRRPRIQAPAPPPKEPKEAGTDGEAQEAEIDKTPPEPVYGEPELTSFPGNKAAKDLAKLFHPLEAVRRFDGLGEEQLADMGLDAPEGQLVVEGRNRRLNLDVGTKAYGSSDIYVREPGSQTVYLLSRKVVGPLKSASSSLRDKNLFGFEAGEVATATVQLMGMEAPIKASHQGRHDKDNSFWTRPGSAEERDAPLDALLKAVFGSKASKYILHADQPGGTDLEALFTVGFAGDNGSLGQLEIARRKDEDKSSADKVAYSWYARSHRTRDQWAGLSARTGEELTEAAEALRSR
ncbi:MAG: DUF4340 domain-containing protein [Myxococcota bacterium]|nr:DUF4340 domain-containing protein [Myxococcota bacterium]